MPKIKIVHLITNLEVGGAEMMLYKLLSRMNQEHFDNIVISMIGIAPSMKTRMDKLGIPIYLLNMRAGRPTLGGCITLIKILVRERPRILQTWMYHADLLGAICGRLLKVRHVVWNIRHSNLDLTRDSRMTIGVAKLCGILSRWASVVVVNSRAGRSFHANISYRPHRWAVIPNGFDLNLFTPDTAARKSFREELNLCSETVLIGLVCSYRAIKDHPTFLSAALNLVNDYPDVHFILVGRDVDQTNVKLTRIIEGHSSQDNFHFMGERTDIPRIMAALDILTSSSYSEGFSNTIGEAMCCGIPCVVTDVGDSRHIVGDVGIVVPPKSPQEMANGWRRLLEKGAEGRRELGQNARKRMVDNYSIETVVRQYEDLYTSLAAICIDK